jgi:tripeptide aminopeptidase
MPPTAPITAFTRIAQLAADRRVHQAFQWIHLQEQQILRWQTDLVLVAAPPFGEKARAEWLCERFREHGLEDVALDGIGNAIGVLKAKHPAEHCLLLSAHIDTIFPPGTPIEPRVEGTRLHAPGACDNGAGVIALLALAAAFRHAGIAPDCDIYFAGNVGEEGEGDLRGIRHIYNHADWRDRIAAHIVLDGAGHEVAVTDGLGSQRYLVTLTGSGGHSWTDAGRPNPIIALSQAIARLAELEFEETPRTTFNVGTIEGGTAINAIPEQASARFDFRSTDPEQLIRLEVELHRAVEDAVIAANKNFDAGIKRRHALDFSIKRIGSRPAGRLDPDSPLYDILRAVDRQLTIRTEPRVASTDANIPLSRGISAVSLGAGGEGGGIHTRAEWYDARGRELGLRRILLLLLGLAAEYSSFHSANVL